jgi:hypothetical protein
VLLLISYPTKALTNPVFYLKITFIALAIWNVRVITRTIFGDANLDLKPVTQKCKLLAIGSLTCWAGAITAGRLLAYTYKYLTARWL